MTIHLPAFIHPRERDLGRFAHGSLDEPSRTRVTSHLEHCVRCRAVVTSERTILDLAARAPRPEPKRELLERVLSRRAAGDRVILPVDEPADRGIMPRRSGTVAAIAATLVLGVALALVTRSRNALAGDTDGVLHLSPELPRERGRMSVEYDAPTLWAKESRLVLRARVLTPADQAYAPAKVIVVPLERGEDGRFRGDFALPDSVVYAAMVVEDTAAQRVDTHANRMWELLTTRDGRQPSYEALEQRENYWMGRSWETGYATAQRAASLYSEDARSWGTLWFYQHFVLGPGALDSARQQHRRRFAQFQVQLSAERRVPATVMGTMYFYALGLDDSASAAYWDARLRLDAPADPFTVQNRVVEVARRWRRDSVAALVAYESLWRDVGHVPGAIERQGKMLPRLGLDAAWRFRDVDAMRRWAARDLAANADDTLYVAGLFAQVPALRMDGLAWIRGSIAAARVPDDAKRPLDRTKPEHRRKASLRYGALLASYGKTLMQLGDWSSAADTLDLAASIGWSPDAMREGADAHLALGDTTNALRLLAGVAVDPATEDSVRSRINALKATAAGAEWQRWTDSARTVMRERVLADATSKLLRGRIELRESDRSASNSLDELRRGAPAVVVVFWSAHCAPALESVSAIERLRTRLQPSGIPVLVVSGDSLTPADRALVRARGGAFPIYMDVRHEAQRAFSNFGTPAFYVLDRGGRVRFQWSEPEDIPRQLAALEK